MGQPPKKPTVWKDDPFFYRDGLDEIELPDDVRKRREAARAQSRARRPSQVPQEQPTSIRDDAIDRANDKLGRDMIEFQKRMDCDPVFRANIQKRTFRDE